jgi:hypothetical protein
MLDVVYTRQTVRCVGEVVAIGFKFGRVLSNVAE